MFRREQLTPVPAVTGPSPQPDEQQLTTDDPPALSKLVRHQAGKHKRHSPSPERAFFCLLTSLTTTPLLRDTLTRKRRAIDHKHQVPLLSIWIGHSWGRKSQIGIENVHIHTNEYLPLCILRKDYDLDPQEVPASLTIDRKRAVIPVDQIGEWFHFFMTYATIKAKKYPEDGSQLMTYMDHILTMHEQKGPCAWSKYDYRFHVRRAGMSSSTCVLKYSKYSTWICTYTCHFAECSTCTWICN